MAASSALPSLCTSCALRVLRNAVPRRALHTSRPLRHSSRPSVLSLLEERGYIHQFAGDRAALEKQLQRSAGRRGEGRSATGFYAGIDPTAPSLHLGHLLPLMVLFWLYVRGQHVVSLVGGATARVGDPSGRLVSRTATGAEVQESNRAAMVAQMGRLWENVVSYGVRRGFREEEMGRRRLLDNSQWLDGLGVLDFLQTLGNGMRLGGMLSRETVKNKMEKGDGMSFSEFTYPLLQAWDWWHMYKTMGIQVQIGGSDQYGNIVAGLNAVKYIAQGQQHALSENTSGLDEQSADDNAPMGLTVPLLTTSAGEKFGKSAGNAVWLDRDLTSPFDLYGFLLRSGDEEVAGYLKLFTFVPLEEIRALMMEHDKDRGKRVAQHRLASEVLELVHGHEEAQRTREQHTAMRGSVASGTAASAEQIVLPHSLVSSANFAKILYHAGLAPSRGGAARMISQGGVYVLSGNASPALEKNGAESESSITSGFMPVENQTPAEAIQNGVLTLRMGKWKVRSIQVISDKEFEEKELDAPGWAEFKADVGRL